MDNAEALWRDMCAANLLFSYPAKLLDYVVPLQTASFLRSIPAGVLHSIPPEQQGVEEATAQMELFFKDVGPDVDSGEKFREVVQCASGRLIVEFRMVSNLLQTGRFTPTREDIDFVKDKFRQCPGLDAVELKNLDYVVMPERPLLPNGNTPERPSEWISRAVNAYLPYRHWQTKKGIDDREVEDAVQSFSDWYMRNYANIHQKAEISLVHALGSFHDVVQADTLSFILMADGLPVTFWPLLEDALRKTGFHRHLLEYRFAPLPTDTEFVKPALVSGDWDEKQKSYETILQKRVSDEWKGKNGFYLSNLKMLADFLAPAEPAVVLLNLLASDEILHGDPEAKGETHDGELYRLFTRVSEMISAMLERWPGERGSFGLYILTDHGACYILDSEKQSFDSKIVSKLFTDERRRFAMIEKETADTVPVNLWDLGYRFDPPFRKSAHVFFIPRGHSTVYSGGKKGYSHGGATPEEVIVPAAIFRASKATWKTPSARFSDLRIDAATGKAVFYVQRLTSLRMEMRNPNMEDIRITRIEVSRPRTEPKGWNLLLLKKGEAATVQIDCYFDKSALGQDELALHVVYEIAGEERTLEMAVKAEFKSAVTGGFSLKDLKR